MGSLTLVAPLLLWYPTLDFFFLLEQVLKGGWAHLILCPDSNNAWL